MALPVISVAQMREWERATWASGQTEAEVIRRVGLAVARSSLELTCPGDLILILAGKGHNGEDARAARDPLTNRRVDVLDVTNPQTDLPKLVALLSLHPSLIIDGLFGIGLNRPLSHEWMAFINRINSVRAKVLAVDVPSGLNAETGEPEGAAVEASVTLTVGAPKIGMLKQSAWQFVGRLEVTADVGLVPCPLLSELKWTMPADFVDFPPKRAAATHKGTYGHLAIIAGSLGFHGAAVLTARAAQRAQPGLITLHTLKSVYGPIASQLQAVMVQPLRDNTELPASFDAVLIGPGLAAPGQPEKLKKRIRNLWRKAEVPVIVDASALDWLPKGPVVPNALRVITPHPGEAGRLLGKTSQQGQADRLNALRELSDKFGGAWVVLKGHQTLVGRNTGPVFVNSCGNPHLAQGGSGDVLSGFIAGLLTQAELRQDPLTTIRYAVWQHGATADHLQKLSRNWVVEDLVTNLGNIHPRAQDSAPT